MKKAEIIKKCKGGAGSYNFYEVVYLRLNGVRKGYNWACFIAQDLESLLKDEVEYKVEARPHECSPREISELWLTEV